MSLSRRSFLSSLSALPVIGPLLKQTAPEVVPQAIEAPHNYYDGLEGMQRAWEMGLGCRISEKYVMQITADSEICACDYVKMSRQGGVIPCSGLETTCIGMAENSAKVNEITRVMSFRNHF